MSLASLGDALSYLAHHDLTQFHGAVAGVRQRLQESIAELNGNKRRLVGNCLLMPAAASNYGGAFPVARQCHHQLLRQIRLGQCAVW